MEEQPEPVKEEDVWRLMARYGMPPVPDDAPHEFRERYAQSVSAIGAGKCEECLAYGEITMSDDGTTTIKLDHLGTCPLDLSQIQALADQLGYEWDPSPIEVDLPHEPAGVLLERPPGADG